MRYTLFLSATNYGLAPQALSKNFILQTARLYSHCSAALRVFPAGAPLCKPAKLWRAQGATSELRAHSRTGGTGGQTTGLQKHPCAPAVWALRSRAVTDLHCARVARRGGQALGQGHVAPPNICLSKCTHSCVFGVGLYSSNSSTTGHTELHGTKGNGGRRAVTAETGGGPRAPELLC